LYRTQDDTKSQKIQRNVHKFYEEFGYRITTYKYAYMEVERVRTYKLLGVIISDDLKWNAHVEYAIAKAAKRLYWGIRT